jgi:hypothetical protein
MKINATRADISLGPGPVNFLPAGEDVNVTGKARSGGAARCAEKFVPLPEKRGGILGYLGVAMGSQPSGEARKDFGLNCFASSAVRIFA